MTPGSKENSEIIRRLNKLEEDGCQTGKLQQQAIENIKEKQKELRNELKSDLEGINTPINEFIQLEKENRENMQSFDKRMSHIDHLLHEDIEGQHNLRQAFEKQTSERMDFRKELLDDLETWKKETLTHVENLVKKLKVRWWPILIPVGLMALIVTLFSIMLQNTTNNYEAQMRTTTASLTMLINHILEDSANGKLNKEHWIVK